MRGDNGNENINGNHRVLVLFSLVGAGSNTVSANGRITSVHWPSGSINGGYNGYPLIWIENTGSEDHEFYVEVDVQDPTGNWHTKSFAHSDTIASGKDAMSMPLITLDTFQGDDLPGYYNGRVTLYDGFFKHNLLDSQTQYNVIKAT